MDYIIKAYLKNIFNDDVTNIIFKYYYIDYMEEKKEYIKTFLSMGFVIFPCNIDKTPRIKRWNYKNMYYSTKLYNSKIKNNYNSTDPYLNNIGLLTGKNSKIIVIDIDFKDNGILIWNMLLDKFNNGNKIDTLTVSSGNRGRHLYFKLPDRLSYLNSSNRLFIDNNNNKYGIDIRCNNGYIILPPSIHPNSNIYKFDNIYTPYDLDRTLIKNIPDWLNNILYTFYKKNSYIKKEVVTNKILINNILNLDDTLNKKNYHKYNTLRY
mgnify:CR=1 FL=1|tara:strand:+ start:36 stop:830 length:795 start_codon:yes stop_codon:yes gene_type:complete